ncbi:hypothetical protein CIHG_06176 [Coccidioides immitis H538.4]|uniref:Uncharacterized protein n=1 Tax=Coccidioides immitis H538.4 TaxID=396776 RepID=A0A0J8ULF5_COCIT|nr:hypothetical protein CIHG_06176 [Coccidioides immitis H538.4]
MTAQMNGASFFQPYLLDIRLISGLFPRLGGNFFSSNRSLLADRLYLANSFAPESSSASRYGFREVTDSYSTGGKRGSELRFQSWGAPADLDSFDFPPQPIKVYKGSPDACVPEQSYRHVLMGALWKDSGILVAVESDILDTGEMQGISETLQLAVTPTRRTATKRKI